MSLVRLRREDFDFLDQIRIYGGVIHSSFAHIVLYLYRNIGNYTNNFRKKSAVVANRPEEFWKETWGADSDLHADNPVEYGPR